MWNPEAKAPWYLFALGQTFFVIGDVITYNYNDFFGTDLPYPSIGDVVYLLGNMVDRHAFRGAGTKWVRLDVGDVTDLTTLPEATPTKANAGVNDLVLVRIGDTVNALHAVCAHAGGPLPQG